MKIAICDDDPPCREQVFSMVNQYNEQRHRDISISVYDRAAALLDAALRFRGFDIYILDIIMPDINGIQLGVSLRQFDPDGKILYLTSSPEYGYDSYQAKASAYILKPVEQERLYSALDEAVSTIVNRREKSLIVRNRESNVKLPLDNILYVELVEKRVVYHMLNADTFESNSIRTTFSDCIRELLADGRFVLCKPGVAVNLYHITMTDMERLFFKNGKSLHIGKRGVRDLRSVWSDFWLSGEGSK